LELVNNVLISSANNIGLDLLFVILGMSFTWRRKSRVPKIESCGITCLIFGHLEKVL